MNSKDGYIVSVYTQDADGTFRWLPIRNFGDRQGDAIEYRDHDVPDLSDAIINALVRKFRVSVRYKRIRKNRYEIVK